MIRYIAFDTNLLRGDKYASKVKKEILFSYAITWKGYKLLDIEINTLFINRDVVFNETVFPFQSQDLNSEDD